MLFNMSILPLTELLYDVSHFLSQLLLEYCEVCCGDHVRLLFLLELTLVLLLPQCCAWPRSCPSITDAPLPCQMQVYFVTRLS